MRRGLEWWDRWFLGLAGYVASASKDPSTRTGAVIVRPNRTIVSVGFNGFPRGISDAPEIYADRELKYERIVHCEMNAAISAGESLSDCTFYTYPLLSCSRCCVHMIQAGIKRAVAPKLPDHLRERWEDSVNTTKALFAEAGVDVQEYELTE